MNIVVDLPRAFDGTPGRALANALAVAHEEDTIVLHLHRPHTDIPADDLNDEIDALTAFLSSRGVSFTICPVVTEPDIADALLACARRAEAGLLVVEFPTEPVTGSVLGKQAQRLILESPCSVLVAR